jgi:ATP-dependent RNA circularization protein (DNA/RNA ligase family)
MKLHPAEVMPDFPRTQHLPYKPNTATGDKIASVKEAAILFNTDKVVVEEKIDGANTGMCLFEGNAIIRNRNHILSKAFTQRKTAAKMQFASIFNWFYENMDKFQTLNDTLGFDAAVYGEWMYAVHGLQYTNLPSIWMPYDIYDWQKQLFLPSNIVRDTLEHVGFKVPTLLHKGKVESYEQLDKIAHGMSEFAPNEKREGIYVKVYDNDRVIERFKMVREGFVQGSKWSDDKITRNKIV